MLTSSVISFPERGPDGRSNYRGNTSGKVVEAFLRMFHRDPQGLFVDPCEGGGTSRDVAARLGIRYTGFDLNQGFDLTVHDLAQALNGERPLTAFVHLPYWHMVIYSQNPRDLCNAPTLEAFLERGQAAAINVYDALRPGGFYAFLMGNLRRKGEYYPLAALFELILPGKLREEIVKVQHNTWSGRQQYSGAGVSFVPIEHEKLLIYEKAAAKFMLDVAIEKSLLLVAIKDGTWRNLIRRTLGRAGNPLTLQQIYERVEGSERAKTNPHWREKVRQVVREHPGEFKCLDRGMYALAV